MSLEFSAERSRLSRTDQKRNLDRSIMLLDESLSSPRSGLRNLQRERNLNLSRDDAMDYDKTQVMLNRPTQQKTLRRQTLNLLGKALNTTVANYQGDLTSVTTNDPFLIGVNLQQILEDFLEAYQSFPLDHQIFEQVARYDNVCSEQLMSLQQLVKTSPQGHWQLGAMKALENQFRLERDTWRLVTSLYQDRLNAENPESGIEDEAMELDRLLSQTFHSEVAFVNRLYEKNSQLRQAQLVVDWLEQKASDLFDESQLQFFGDPAAGWENTLHRLLTKSADAGIVNEMDPDAPLRNTSRKLDPLDQEDESRLLRCVFARLRCGQLEEAQQLFFRSGHIARAAILEGWRLYDDPNLELEGRNVQIKKPASGNPYRDVWKAAAWKACESKDLTSEEKAIYGVLCGHLGSLLTLSDSWEDVLWSQFRTSVDRIVEKEVRLHVTYNRELEPMPDSYWEQQTSVEKIFAAVAASRNPNIASQAMDRYRIIQRYVILDDVDGLLEEMFSWIQKPEESDSAADFATNVDPQLLRLMVHLALFFRRIGRGSRDDLISAIIQSYVESLVVANSTELIAPYIVQLPLPSEQVELFARSLVKTEDMEECSEDRRRMLLALADQLGLDVNAIACRTVQIICKQADVQLASDSSLQVPTGADDVKRIHALGWLLVDDSMRADLLAEANNLMRSFLLRRQIDALKTTYQTVPSDIIRTLSDQWQTRAGNLELPVKVQNSIREYICFKTYMDALTSFQDWFIHYHNSKPRPPVADQSQWQRGRPQLSFAENLLREQQTKQYEADLQRWQAGLELLAKSATERLYNVLLFPDGGWMVDSGENPADEDEETQRAHQMKLLRQSCIPHVAMLLTSVLQDTEQHEQCLHLADVIAAEPNALYRVFTAEQLSRLLAQLGKSYVRVLDNGQDL